MDLVKKIRQKASSVPAGKDKAEMFAGGAYSLLVVDFKTPSPQGKVSVS